jgi:hypothetical protein
MLVYTLAQRKLRQALNAAQTGIPNQLGKPMYQIPTRKFYTIKQIRFMAGAANRRDSYDGNPGHQLFLPSPISATVTIS